MSDIINLDTNLNRDPNGMVSVSDESDGLQDNFNKKTDDRDSAFRRLKSLSEINPISPNNVDSNSISKSSSISSIISNHSSHPKLDKVDSLCQDIVNHNIEHADVPPPMTSCEENNIMKNSNSLKKKKSNRVFVEKKNVYAFLMNWEAQRFDRATKLDDCLDKILISITTGFTNANNNNQQLLRYLRDQSKIIQDITSKVKSTQFSIGKNLSPPSSSSIEPYSPCDNQTKTPDSARSVSASSLYSIQCDSNEGYEKLIEEVNVVTVPWVQALYTYNNNLNNCFTNLEETLQSEQVSGLCGACINDYEKNGKCIISRCKKISTTLKYQNKVILKSWIDLEKHFKNCDNKDNKSDKSKQIQESKSLQANEDGTQQSSSTSPDSRDAWLVERRYLHSVTASHQLELSILTLFEQSIADLYKLEEYRVNALRNSYLRFINELKESLSSIASSLGCLHSIIDPDGFSHERDLFLTNDQESNTVSTVPSNLNPENLVYPNTEFISKNNKIIEGYHPNVKQFISFVRELVEKESTIPEPRLSIKSSHVKRLSGFWSKWSEGLLILTWDRYLHMFRSYDDMQPLWSIFTLACEIQVVDEKHGLKTIYIKPKKSSLMNLGLRNQYCFRPFSTSDLNSWIKCLNLASIADDQTYHIEGIQSAESAEVALIEDYNTWTEKVKQVNSDSIVSNT